MNNLEIIKREIAGLDLELQELILLALKDKSCECSCSGCRYHCQGAKRQREIERTKERLERLKGFLNE